MRGTTSPSGKRTDDSGSVFEALLIDDCRCFRSLAGNWPQRLFGVLQHYPTKSGLGSDIAPRPFRAANKGHGSRDQDIEIQGFEGTLCTGAE